MLGKVVKLDNLDELPESSSLEQITAFTHLMQAMMKAYRKDPEGQTKEEREYAERQPDQPSGLKTAEVPEFEDIPRDQLITALDINSKLTHEQRSKIEKILIQNHQAFSLDGRIGRYEGIQYEIKVEPGAAPVSLAPYSASPEKREAIDKQLDKWFSQEVIEPSDSPWGAPVIVVY